MVQCAALLAGRCNVMPVSADFGADTDRPTDRHMHTHTACICNLHADKQGSVDAAQSCLRCAQSRVMSGPSFGYKARAFTSVLE